MLPEAARNVFHRVVGFEESQNRSGARPRRQEAAILRRKRKADSLWFRVESPAGRRFIIAAGNGPSSAFRLLLLWLHSRAQNDLSFCAEGDAGPLPGGIRQRCPRDQVLGSFVPPSGPAQ